MFYTRCELQLWVRNMNLKVEWNPSPNKTQYKLSAKYISSLPRFLFVCETEICANEKTQHVFH